MEKIHWLPKYNIGNEIIDNQHQFLIEIINEIIEVRKVQMNMEDIKVVFKKLIQYANIHFHDEEKLMIEVDYPNYSEHKSKHKEFIGELMKVEQEIVIENKYVSFEILIFLAQWFINHIQVMDKDLAPYLYEEDWKI